jgi:hypothetical protein
MDWTSFHARHFNEHTRAFFLALVQTANAAKTDATERKSIPVGMRRSNSAWHTQPVAHTTRSSPDTDPEVYDATQHIRMTLTPEIIAMFAHSEAYRRECKHTQYNVTLSCQFTHALIII